MRCLFLPLSDHWFCTNTYTAFNFPTYALYRTVALDCGGEPKHVLYNTYVVMFAVLDFSLCRQAISRPHDGMLSLSPSLEKEKLIIANIP